MKKNDPKFILYGNMLSGTPKLDQKDVVRKWAEHQAMVNASKHPLYSEHTPMWPLLIPLNLLVFFIWTVI